MNEYLDVIMERLSIHSDSKDMSGQIAEKVSSITEYEYRKIFNKKLKRTI